METVDSSVVSEIKTGRTGRRDSIISLLSDLNEDGNKDSEVDDFVPSKRFNFRFSEAELLQIKRVFDAFDDNCDGIIDIQYLGVALRASGLILTEKDIVDISKDADPEDRGEIDLGKFFVITARHYRDLKAIEASAKKAFHKISKSNMVSGQDDIPIAALRSMLISRGGEPFIEPEVEEFMKDVQAISDKKKSTVSVKALVQYIFGEASIEEIAEKVSMKSRYGDSDSATRRG